MESSNQTKLCRLCLQTSDDLVYIWKTFRDVTIATILVKHFWFQINKNDGLTEWLCQICWEQTKAFHEFYERVERFQKSYWESVESDTDGNDETIVIDHELTIVKCEETELRLETIEDVNFDSSDDCNEAEPISNDKSKSAGETPQIDDNRIVPAKRKTSSFSRSDKLINQAIREEQNRELNGQIREWFTMKCDICDIAELDTWLGVKRHYRNVHQTNGYLRCCNKKFDRRRQILDHIRHHIITPESSKLDAQICNHFTMKCDICADVPFATLADVKRHYREVHNMRGYLSCCNKKFDARHSMATHMRRHTNPDTYRCEPCKRNFKTKYSFKIHVANHVPLDSRAFKCNFCTSSFPTQPILRLHIKTKHPTDTGEKFHCDKCNKNYRSELMLKNHIRHVHRSLNYVCEVCARQFKSKHAFLYHFTDEHSTTPLPKVQCDICGNWLKNKYNLARHVKDYHHEKKPTTCHICKKIVPNKKRLGYHIRMAHGEKKHECVLCDKVFRCPKFLKEHVATHTGEDLYKCQYCEKKFKSSANLYSHRKKAHLAEWTQDNERNIATKEAAAKETVTKTKKDGTKALE